MAPPPPHPGTAAVRSSSVGRPAAAGTIDADQHVFEPRTMWRDHIDPALRQEALAVEDDALGWPWLTWRGRRLYPAEPQTPRRPELIGASRLRQAAGLPPLERYDEAVPPSYEEPAARLDALDSFGVEAAVLFPNFGLVWEPMLGEHPRDLPALLANLRAANRWQAEAIPAGAGRLFPVAHLSLRDPAWAVDEIVRLGRDGLRLAMIAPAPVGGRPLSHPDLDPVWAACCDHGVTPVFHVGAFDGPLDPAWYAGDPEPVDRLMDSVFLWVAPAVALANMILHGTLERFPDLRIGVVELTAGWVPTFLLHLDGARDFYVARHGAPFCELSLRPSEYFRRQVRVAVLAEEGPSRLIRQAGEDLFMFGSDWPHAEGIARPVLDYESGLADLSTGARDKLMGGNARFLLRLEEGL
ncbi:MAG: amidohydrolase family protein [Acidimicrobiales bacterium]